MENNMNNLDYFIKYVRVSTQSDDTTGTTPSTEYIRGSDVGVAADYGETREEA